MKAGFTAEAPQYDRSDLRGRRRAQRGVFFVCPEMFRDKQKSSCPYGAAVTESDLERVVSVVRRANLGIQGLNN